MSNATENRTVEFDTYKDKPMIRFQLNERDRYAFQFGPAKAQRLIAAIEEVGAEEFVDMLYRFVKGGTDAS